ncbi:MAG: hypothetical protein U1F10_15670 [Burkholderiales bacterium]
MRCALLLLAFVAATAAAQPRYGLAPDAYALLARTLATSCLGDDAQALRVALAAQRATLAPAFRRALADGPPEDAVAAVRAAADRRYAALVLFPLRDYRVEGIAAADLARFARPSRRSYVDAQVQRYVTGYRANAVAALGVVGGSQDRGLLVRYAREDPALAPAVAEAVRMLGR